MANTTKAVLGLAAIGLAAAYASSPSRKKKHDDGDERDCSDAQPEDAQPVMEPEIMESMTTVRKRRTAGSPPALVPKLKAGETSRFEGAEFSHVPPRKAKAASDGAATSKNMKKSESFTDLAGRMILSPTQRLRLETKIGEREPSTATGSAITATMDTGNTNDTSVSKAGVPPSRSARKSKRNSSGRVALGILFVYLISASVLAKCYEVESDLAGFFTLVKDVLSLDRIPSSAQDIPGAIVATCVCMLIVFLMDVLIAKPMFPGDAAQWFCLHALANAFVVVGAVPDFYFVSLVPSKALSAAHCYDMGKWACSDWPTCMIIAIHVYHMLAFKLTSDDLFHHLTFVPVIGGGHFVWPWGAAGNILCFFISGFPGGIDYALLALVKAGHVSSLTEKRINLSINVWIRAPGITAFCILAVGSWLQSSEWLGDGPPSEIMPGWGFGPALLLVFYNGQYYSQRVIGNYYIRVTQDEYSDIVKEGANKPRVELHAC